MMPGLGAALGAGALVAGVLVVIIGIMGTRGPSRPPSQVGSAIGRFFGSGLSASARKTRRTILGGALLALVAGWLYSGIPVVGIGAGIAVIALPWLFGAGRAENQMIARLEAIEAWSRRLADLVRSGAGLHQAIIVSANDAPPAIAIELDELAAELRGDMTTIDALRRFADRLGDAHSDEVIAALMLNARERGPRLADVLDRVSENIADVITMVREQASGRTDARITAMFLSGMTLVGLLFVAVNKSYMKPYHSFVGQVILAFCLLAFGALLLWCRQLNMPKRTPRLLTGTSPRRRAS